MKAKKGRLYPVKNRKRKTGANSVYFQAWLETAGEWEPFMFTADQLQEAQLRANINPEDCKPKRRFLFW